MHRCQCTVRGLQLYDPPEWIYNYSIPVALKAVDGQLLDMHCGSDVIDVNWTRSIFSDTVNGSSEHDCYGMISDMHVLLSQRSEIGRSELWSICKTCKLLTAFMGLTAQQQSCAEPSFLHKDADTMLSLHYRCPSSPSLLVKAPLCQPRTSSNCNGACT